ncbi:MAG: ABC transporter permease [Chloroflexota bacterium]|nr:ABC transporter permease [Chloroflexota bacterium]
MTGSSTEALASPRVKTAQRSFRSLAIEGLRDIAQRRRLIRYLVGADLKRTHADTIFGQLWWIFDPLLQMAVYVVLVQVIFQRNIPDYPLFLFAAILPWKWFATTINDATMSVVNRQTLIRQIQFPKVVLPTAAVVAGSVSFLIGLIALGIVYVFYINRLSPWILLLPIIAAVQLVFTLALALSLSAINAFFRDLQNVMRHLVRLWFYLSPGLWTIHDIHNPTARIILSLNPFTALFESYRSVTWGTQAPDFGGLLYVLVLSCLLLAFGLALFKRVEPAFARIL